MQGPFTFTFTLESEEFEKSEKVGAAADLYQTMITTRAPDGANKLIKTAVETSASSYGFEFECVVNYGTIICKSVIK